MYTPWLMCAYAVALLLVLAGLEVVRRNAPELRGTAWLRRFVISDILAVSLLALRSQLAPLFGILLANYLLFAGAVFLCAAAAEILGARKRKAIWAAALCIVTLPLFLWLTFIHPAAFLRLELHCAVVAVIFAMTAGLLFRYGRDGLRDPARAAAWVFILACVVNVAWGTFAIVGRPQASYARPDPVDAGFSYLSMIVALSTAVSLAWLSFCVHRQELQQVARTDGLTGLLNRGAFEELLARELRRAQTGKCILSVIMMDIDHFKRLNDSQGHLAGDDVLRRLGTALRLGVRPSDVLARFGGEEFVILLRDAEAKQAEEVAERLRSDVAGLRGLPGSIMLTASFGVAVNQSGDSASDLLMRADEALYCSKREGRNLVSVHRRGDQTSLVTG